MIRFITGSAEETEAAGGVIAGKLKKGDIVAICGGLGAGKTALVKGIAARLAPAAQVTSPTFSLVNVYEGEVPLYHFDLYRLEGADDLCSIGFDDYLDGGGICLVEWSERSREMGETVRVDIVEEQDGTRVITADGGASW
ncbi:MAG TPA: tRNA (adenosine(37)-N6)-threonylcarbamoyltransferase complex ATPase subunit type 1 TsaE [Candidatus Acidoferrum sp.]|nr:tRNA (adenosine(37)-N6)-threonylcarbamoyltransferase complex ATPase subunit type 1 TsaE [Candidatus Acidoferrum sp.]